MLAGRSQDLDNYSAEDLRKLIHELQVRQVELESQNEELRTTQSVALQKERSFSTAILNTVGSLVCVLDTQGHIVRFNHACEKLTGYSFEEVKGKSALDLFLLPEEREAVGAVFAQLVASHFPSKAENYWVARDGSRRLIDWSNTVLLDQTGTVEYVIGAGVDITQARKNEKEKVRLFEAVNRQRKELRALTRRLNEVQEADRKELSRELHDQVGRNLTALGLNLNIICAQLAETSCGTGSIKAYLDDSLELVEETAECVRDIMASLRPPVLDDYGLVAALRWYGELFSARAGFTVVVMGNELDPRLAEPVENAFFRVAQEALTNIAKHAQATKAMVIVETRQDTVRLVIADNGCGFDPTQVKPAARSGWGLLTMTERVEAVGGCCRIEASPGAGTRVIVEMPR